MAVPAAPPPGDFPIGPALTAAGILISLGWNFVNTRLANSIKRQDRRLDEFKRVRTRLDSAIDELRATMTSLRSLSLTASTNVVWEKELKKLNLALSVNDGRIRAVLGDFNRSRYVHGNDWLDALAPHWDHALSSLEGGYNSTKALKDKKKSVADCASHLEVMIAAIEKRLEAEMARYASDAN